MTGITMLNFTAPKGYYQHVFGGAEGPRLHWEELYVDADIPPGTYLRVRVRGGSSEADLEASPFSNYLQGVNADQVGESVDFPPNIFPVELDALPSVADSKLLQVEVSLYSPKKDETPVVKSITVTYVSTD